MNRPPAAPATPAPARATPARATLACAFATGAFVACQVLAGIEDRPFVVDGSAPGADANGGEAGTGLPDPCAHAGTPPKPDAPHEETSPMYVLALRSADFTGGDDAGQPIGFDLDGVCTCDKRPGTAHGGQSACALPGAASVACDHEGGIDNAIFEPFATLAQTMPNLNEQLLGNQIACGRESLLFYLIGYNGKADDDKLTVGLVPSWGIRTPHDAGEVDAADCYGSPAERAQAPFPPRWDGTDRWSFSGVAAARNGDAFLPFGAASDAYVTGFRLVIPPDATRDLKFFLGEHAVDVWSPIITADLVGVDGQGRDVDGGVAGGAVAFRAPRGVFGGRIPSRALLEGLGLLRKSSNGADYFCQDPAYALTATHFVCAARDIAADPAADFQALPDGAPFPCDAISMAMRFTAGPAQIGDPYDPDAGLDAACPPSWGGCP